MASPVPASATTTLSRKPWWKRANQRRPTASSSTATAATATASAAISTSRVWSIVTPGGYSTRAVRG